MQTSQDPDDDDRLEGHLFSNPKHPAELLARFHELYAAGLFTDISLVCGDQMEELTKPTIECHKLVLAAVSPFFFAMLSTRMAETLSSQVKMPAAGFGTLKAIVDYAYSGRLLITVGNVQSLFALATQLQMSDIVLACGDFMQSHLDPSNCLEVLTFAQAHSCRVLVERAVEYIRRNFSKVCATDEFLELDDAQLLRELIDSDLLDIESEGILLDAITRWVSYKFSAREAAFGQLFELVRLSLLFDKSYLQSYIEAHGGLLASSPRCLEALRQVLDDAHSSQVASSSKRLGMLKADYCFLLLGGNWESKSQLVDCFNPYTGEKFILSSGYRTKSKHTARGAFHVENPGVYVTDSNRVFLAGGNYVFHAQPIQTQPGSTGTRYRAESSSSDEEAFADALNKEMFEYDCQHDLWTRRASMLFAKSNFSLCSMGDKLYAFGGIVSGHVQSDVIEYYDMSEDKWSYVGTMPNPFVAGCVVRHQNAFYILGGRCGVGKFNNCFKYVPETQEWSELRGMRTGRFNFGAIVLSGKIFVFGGQRYDESEDSFFTREALDSVEIYDIEADQWSEGPKMPSPLYNTGAGLSSEDPNCIYVCGTTECEYSGNRLLGFMFTSVFRMNILRDDDKTNEIKWTVVEHDVSEIKANYRCLTARLNTRRLKKVETDIVTVNR